MPRIPEYQQDKLASAQVGTPGIDTSIGDAYKQASSSYGQLAYNTSILASQAAQQESSIRVAKQRALDLAEKERQKISDQITTTTAQFELTNQLGDLSAKLAAENQANPEQTVSLLQEQGTELVKQYAGQFPRPNLQANVLKGGLSVLTGQLGSARSHAQAQRTKNDIARVDRSRQLLVDAAGKTDSLEALQGIWNQLDQFSDLAYVVKGDGTDKFIAEGKEKATEQFLYNMLGVGDAGDPKGVVSVLDSGVLDDVLPADKRFSFKKKFYDYAESRQKELDRAQKEGVYNRVADIELDVNLSDAEGTATPADIDKNISELQGLADEAKDSATKKRISTTIKSLRATGARIKKRQEVESKAAAKQEATNVYNSDAAINARAELDAVEHQIHKMYKDKTKTVPPELRDKYRKMTIEAKNNQYIKDAPARLQEIKKIENIERSEGTGKGNNSFIKSVIGDGISAINSFFGGGKKPAPQSQEANAEFRRLKAGYLSAKRKRTGNQNAVLTKDEEAKLVRRAIDSVK